LKNKDSVNSKPKNKGKKDRDLMFSNEMIINEGFVIVVGSELAHVVSKYFGIVQSMAYPSRVLKEQENRQMKIVKK
jgi:hypothetical protein